MKDNGIDKLFKDALYNMEQPVDVNLWGKIEHSIRMRKVKRVIFYGCSVAAVVLLGLFLSVNPFDKSDSEIDIISQVNIAKENSVKESVPEVKESAFIALADDKSLEINKPVPVAKKAVKETKALQKKENLVEESVSVNNNISAHEQQVSSDVPVAEKPVETAKEAVQETIVSESVYDSSMTFANFTDDISTDKKKPFTIALSSNVSTGRGNVNANENFRAPLGLNGSGGAVQLEQVSEVRYSLPLNLGVQIQFPIRGFISVGTGLNYSMLVSKYDALLDKQMVSVNQTLHYMGVPVNIYFKLLEKSNFNVYANAGVALEWGLGSSYNVKSYDFNRTYNESIDGVLFSMNAGLGVEYVFGNLFGLYLEPNVVYYPNSKIKRSIRTDQPLQIRAEIGCRFHF